MTYLPDLHAYLHQSSLLIQAYPTTRITTKYSLPRKSTNPSTTEKQTTEDVSQPKREKREPSATLTLKTYHPESGICLKYRTDKAQEVGRLMMGLGRLAKGEIVEMPSTNAAAIAGDADKMDVDEPEKVVEEKKVEQTQANTTTGGSGGGGKKKGKKGKK